MTIQERYFNLKQDYQNQYAQAQRTTNIIAAFRLLVAVLFFISTYYFYQKEAVLTLFLSVFACIAVFLRLVVLHLKYKEKAQLFQHLTHINEAEIGYLNGDLSPFKTGEKYTDTAHAYAHDLDIFGQGSIFQHINRTTTQLGESHLAFLLKNEIPVDISAQQKAVKELSELLDWRQHFMAAGLMEIDEDLNIRQFENWLNRPFYYQNASILRGLSYVLPVITLVALVVFAVTNDSSHFSILKGLFITNLAFVAVQQKHIKEEHQLLSSMGSVLKKYGKLLQNIENQDFSAEILRGYTQPNASGSKAIKRLSTISNNFDTILNPIAALLTNGLFQYHIHALFALEKWRAEHKDAVFAWFQTIAKFEALSSIANFAYNNPDFTTPTIESEPILILKQVGHPLIKKEKRICNNVAFYKTKFIVLTGSNMSGKSTFLRTLGVNLILARVGAPVCAEQFAFYPFNVCVSMRIDDSLQNSESLFFSELKRLKSIIETLDNPQKPFIILDEILRGTNSNDKRAGTQGLIHRLIAKKAVGIIATHDLVIGDMQNDYPDYLANKCFEAEITNDELHFDYKLRDGVCQQMSAAFLMKKMEII